MNENTITVKDIVFDSVEIAGKTFLSVIPIGGPLVTYVWDAVKSHTLQKRMDEWKALIEDRLSSVEATLEDIGNNELFASAIIKATESALKTAERSKREYLANAVKNTIYFSVDESKLMVFLDLVDKNTAWHLKVLDYFRDPSCGKKNRVDEDVMLGSITMVMKKELPEIFEDVSMLEKIVYDLQNDGLLKRGDFLYTTMSPKGIMSSRTTPLGNEFLDYISK